MHWLQRKKPQRSAKSRFGKNQEKLPKMTIFQKWRSFCAFSWFFRKWDLAESWGFLRCNQCIKMLHLSYQTPPYNVFNFSTYNWFLKIFRPPVGGSKINFENFENNFYFYYGKRHLKPHAPEKVWNSPPLLYGGQVYQTKQDRMQDTDPNDAKLQGELSNKVLT